MNGLFEEIEEPEAALVRASRNTKWQPVVAALGRGAVLRVRLRQTAAHVTLGRSVSRAYPEKRLRTRGTDDPKVTYVWLVDR